MNAPDCNMQWKHSLRRLCGQSRVANLHCTHGADCVRLLESLLALYDKASTVLNIACSKTAKTSGGTELTQAVPRSSFGLCLIFAHISLHERKKKIKLRLRTHRGGNLLES